MEEKNKWGPSNHHDQGGHHAIPHRKRVHGLAGKEKARRAAGIRGPLRPDGAITAHIQLREKGPPGKTGRDHITHTAKPGLELLGQGGVTAHIKSQAQENKCCMQPVGLVDHTHSRLGEPHHSVCDVWALEGGKEVSCSAMSIRERAFTTCKARERGMRV